MHKHLTLASHPAEKNIKEQRNIMDWAIEWKKIEGRKEEKRKRINRQGMGQKRETEKDTEMNKERENERKNTGHWYN